jgi:hypothetical protein
VDQQIGGIGEAVEHGSARIGPEVEHAAALVAVDAREVGASPIGRVAPPRWSPPSRLVAAGRLKLDDVGAQVGEEHGRERPRQHAADIEHADAGERELTVHRCAVR